ncbi:hypothetical protein BMBphi_gp075 [Bacillus phage vB_BthS_BMBphi]|nr:hypothetical protein BMBphi_gp075 [Bacillus phage vB_BthS_BMBphi]
MRTIRYRQVLRERIGDTGGLYKTQIRLQQLFWNEDKAHAWTIPQVREIHSSLGTWDKLTRWEVESNWKYGWNCIVIYREGESPVLVKPKANYKPIKKAQEARWKEQEQRTLDFLERNDC